MFKGRSGRKPQSFVQLFHERVRVQRVEEVDVTRSAEQNLWRGGVGVVSEHKATRGVKKQKPRTFEWQLPLGDECLRGLLVRIRAVSQYQSLGRPSVLFSARGIGVLLAKVAADGRVVRGGHLERLERESAPERGADVASFALRPRLDKVGVIGGIGEHRDARVVLGRGAQQRDAADVDLLDGVREGAAWARDGRRERVQVADDDGDRRDGLRGEVLLVGGDVAREDACADVISRARLGWMEGSPPCTTGWRVFTRPPSISGALVISATSLWTWLSTIVISCWKHPRRTLWAIQHP